MANRRSVGTFLQVSGVLAGLNVVIWVFAIVGAIVLAEQGRSARNLVPILLSGVAVSCAVFAVRPQSGPREGK